MKTLEKSHDGMLAYLNDMKKFFERTDLSKLELQKLMGKAVPSTSWTGIKLAPHDSRFKTVMLWQDKIHSYKIKSVAFHFPDLPLNMKAVEDSFGKFKAKYHERRKNTTFMIEFPEESNIQDFSFVIENLRVEEGEDGNWIATPPEGGDPQVVGSDVIFFDNYVFYLRDREWKRDNVAGEDSAAYQFSSMMAKKAKAEKGEEPTAEVDPALKKMHPAKRRRLLEEQKRKQEDKNKGR